MRQAVRKSGRIERNVVVDPGDRRALAALAALATLAATPPWLRPTARACCRRVSCRPTSVWAIEGSQRLLPVPAAGDARRRGRSGRSRCGGKCWWRRACGRCRRRRPANAVVHGKVDRDDYTVEKVYFESFPGHFVTGSLYRPKGTQRQAARRALSARPLAQRPLLRRRPEGHPPSRSSTGPSGSSSAGRYPLQARCVQLARMGCVVFHYDMVGYADSVQLAARPGYRAGDEHAGELGLLQPAGRSPPAEHDGPADLQLDPRAGLVPRACPTWIRSGSP